MESSTDLNIHRLLLRMFRKWPIIALLGFAGAILGFVFSLLRSPVYQAEALIGVNIDYGISESLALVVEDRALSRLDTLVMADSTLEKVLDSLPQGSRDTRQLASPADLRTALRLDKRLATWALSVLDTDPDFAATVAEKWAEITLEAFDEANEHAWNAARLLAGSFVVQCEELIVDGEETDYYECLALPQGVDAEALTAQLETEVTLSRGVLPNISYELLQQPHPPEDPILWHRGWLILAGTMVGVAVGGLLSLRGSNGKDHGGTEGELG
jgi:hypothetical protein